MRTLRRQPEFPAAAILSLALGMGANTAIFTLVDAVMLRAMPVAGPPSNTYPRFNCGHL